MHFNIRNQRQPLTLDQIRQAAPSAFASEAYHGMSDQYKYIPTSAIIEGMMSAGFMPFAASQSRTRIQDKREYTKHMIRFRTAQNAVVAVGDVFPEVVLINGHDGSTAYKLMAGLYRLVCSNGLTVADSLVSSVHVPHKGVNVIEAVTTGSVEIVDRMPAVIDCVGRWKGINLSSSDQQAFAEAAHFMRFADSEGHVNTPIQPSQLLMGRRYEDSASDLWTVYNRVQENVIRGGLRGRVATGVGNRTRRVSTRAVNGIDQDVKLNRALWMLAEKMAELRTA